jgi:hypothetical protein
MSAIRRRPRVAILTALLVAGLITVAFAAKWKPYQFKESELYQYKITAVEKGKERSAIYSIRIKPAGEGMVEVTYSTTGKFPKSKLGAGTAWGYWGSWGGASLSMIAMNPAFSAFLTQLDIKEDATWSMGPMKLKVTGKETVAGREGFIVKMFMNEGEGDKVKCEWTVDTSLALPLKSKFFGDRKESYSMELTKYATE